ncbi:hypothetical protein SAMN05216436_104193 [bacterium A37T11]|nr:hypothetical protein SAMN05216436_104193 [bacterium A37T11]
MNKKIVNKIISALGILGLVVVGYLGLNSFKGSEPVNKGCKVEIGKKTNFQTAYWYRYNGPNNYTLIGTGTSTAPTTLCPLTTGTVLCAVGFNSNPGTVNDMVAAGANYRRYKPE